eukprot:CAMPEP_0174230428 /NCGR_PEP_ID=MMETSP0417-20130205/1207_1 /TAXON_ID=242541 /ORGANISM="Mayorella sp, Strain BSH-02190019" /LENGTH=312 /DNA_ID=CAMNT_0015308123 /DNA_START=37 /DNA_END=972 /DNA_ORIENTATION=-
MKTTLPTHPIDPQVLTEVDRALGCEKPPAIEYLFVEPFSQFHIFGFGIPINPYGHAALRYTRPNGEQHVVNISGSPNTRLVSFLPPADYIFGDQTYSEQGGVRSRAMVGIRLEEYPPELVEDIHHFFDKLSRRSTRKTVKFNLVFAKLFNAVGWLLPRLHVERGNCAYWTSKGLVEGDLLFWPTIWPKSIWINVFEEQGALDPSNVHVVSYRRKLNEEVEYGVSAKPLWSGVGPLQSLRNISYRNLEEYANVIVEYSLETDRFETTIQPNPVGPSWWRHHRGSLLSGGLALAGVLLAVSRRGSRSAGMSAHL